MPRGARRVLYYGPVQPTYFERAADFREWLRRYHRQRGELLVGFYKKSSGQPSITYPEALDEALCYGWIDGVRRTVDKDRYSIRFTPRRAGSYWSAVNTRKAQALIRAGRMAAPGLAAFKARDAAKTKQYSYEAESAAFTPAEVKLIKARPRAWPFFAALPPGYKRTSIGYVTSARRPETRRRRLELLIACSAQGRRLPGLPQLKGQR